MDEHTVRDVEKILKSEPHHDFDWGTHFIAGHLGLTREKDIENLDLARKDKAEPNEVVKRAIEEFVVRKKEEVERDYFEVRFKVFKRSARSNVNGFNCIIHGHKVVDGKRNQLDLMPWILPVDPKLALNSLIDAGSSTLENLFGSVFDSQ